jgi:predicted nucleic acid-binding protein
MPVVRGLFMLGSVKIEGVTGEAYFAAVELEDVLGLGAGDVLAVGVMGLNGVTEVCSFDEDFDQVEGIVGFRRCEVCVPKGLRGFEVDASSLG